jgi:hypothetical protein
LLQFCELDWSDECLDMHQSEPRLGAGPSGDIGDSQRLKHYLPLLSGLPTGSS